MRQRMGLAMNKDVTGDINMKDVKYTAKDAQIALEKAQNLNLTNSEQAQQDGKQQINFLNPVKNKDEAVMDFPALGKDAQKLAQTTASIINTSKSLTQQSTKDQLPKIMQIYDTEGSVQRIINFIVTAPILNWVGA